MIEENLEKFICANTWAQLIEIVVVHEIPQSVYWQKKIIVSMRNIRKDHAMGLLTKTI